MITTGICKLCEALFWGAQDQNKYFQCNKDFFGVFAILMTMATQKRRETDTDHRGEGWNLEAKLSNYIQCFLEQ